MFCLSINASIHLQRAVTSFELQEIERRSPGIASEGPVMYTVVGATVKKDMRHISKKGDSYSLRI